MLVLINSMTYGVGASTLTYFLAKTRSTLLSKPSLIISSSNILPYKNMLPITNDWENPTLKMVLSKMRTYTDVKTFCYKVDSWLYYINVDGVDIKSSEGRTLFNQLLKEMRPNITADGFESIWIDLDNYSGGFIHYVDDVDLVLIPIPPDIVKLKTSAERLSAIKQNYIVEFGMQLKTPVYYCLSQYAGQINISTVKNILKTTDKYMLLFGYDKDLAFQSNTGKLSFYVAEVLSEPKTAEKKTIHAHVKRILKELRPQRR